MLLHAIEILLMVDQKLLLLYLRASKGIIAENDGHTIFIRYPEKIPEFE